MLQRRLLSGTRCLDKHAFSYSEARRPLRAELSHALAMHITVFEGLTSRDSCHMQLQGCGIDCIDFVGYEVYTIYGCGR